MAHQVASQLALELTQDLEQRIDSAPTGDLAAYDLVLRGGSLIEQGTVDSLNAATVALEQAREADPTLAEAHALLADALLRLSFAGVEWAEVRDRALAAIDRALELDPGSATAHVVRALIAADAEGDAAAASEHYLRALELAPNDSYPLLRYADFLSNVKARYEEALPLIERARLLDPLSGDVYQIQTLLLLNLGRVDEAAQAWQRGMEVAPDHLGLLKAGVSIRVAQGDPFGFFDLTLRLAARDPTNTEYPLGLVFGLIGGGELELAQRWVDRVRRFAPTHEQYFIAQLAVYVAAGDAAGLERLLEQWRAMNSDQWTDEVWDGMLTPFEVRLRAHLLFAQAAEAHRDGRRDDELALRASAVEVLGDVLRDTDGRIRIINDNILLAIEQAIDLELLGREQEAGEILTALTRFDDPWNEAPGEIFLAHLLAGEVEAALDFAESQDVGLPYLDRVQDDSLGLYDGVAENPRFVTLHREVAAATSV